MSGRQDSNLRPSEPHSDALARLRHAPSQPRPPHGLPASSSIAHRPQSCNGWQRRFVVARTGSCRSGRSYRLFLRSSPRIVRPFTHCVGLGGCSNKKGRPKSGTARPAVSGGRLRARTKTARRSVGHAKDRKTVPALVVSPAVAALPYQGSLEAANRMTGSAPPGSRRAVAYRIKTFFEGQVKSSFAVGR